MDGVRGREREEKKLGKRTSNQNRELILTVCHFVVFFLSNWNFKKKNNLFFDAIKWRN